MIMSRPIFQINVALHKIYCVCVCVHEYVWEEIGSFNRCVADADSMTSTLHAQYDTFECSHAYCPDVK